MIVLSLGAGVQSTTIALMAATGELPHPDWAIFADTGDEKRDTYRFLDWLEPQLPFPLLRIRRFNQTLAEMTLAHYGTDGPLFVSDRRMPLDAISFDRQRSLGLFGNDCDGHCGV